MTRWSPAKGRMLQPGQIVDDIPDEVAVDLIERGIAAPLRTQVERAVGAGQTLTPGPGPHPRPSPPAPLPEGEGVRGEE